MGFKKYLKNQPVPFPTHTHKHAQSLNKNTGRVCCNIWLWYHRDTEEKVSASGFTHVTFIAGQFRLQLKQTLTHQLKGLFLREGVK